MVAPESAFQLAVKLVAAKFDADVAVGAPGNVAVVISFEAALTVAPAFTALTV